MKSNFQFSLIYSLSLFCFVALCSVGYIRSKIFTKLTDTDISNIITEVGTDVLALCRTTDETNPLVILAGKNAILAAVLRRMKTTGELAASIKQGNSQQQNNPDTDIEAYERESKIFIIEFKTLQASSFSSPSYHTGFDHCSHRGHHR